MSTYTHNKATRIVTMNLPKEIPGRHKVRNDFCLFFNDEAGETRFQINHEQSLPVALLKMDFHRTQFMSRAAADEILCQLERLSCKIECENLRDDLSYMLRVVSKKHPSINIINL